MSKTQHRIFVFACTLLIPILPFALIGELPGERWLALTEERDALFAALGAGLLAIDILLPVPSSIVISLLGARIGLFEGWLVAWIGLTLGNIAGYWLGRLWPDRWAPEVAETTTAITLLVSRPVPILAEAAVISAGIARAPFLAVALACSLGNSVYTFLLAASGALLISEGYSMTAIFIVLAVMALSWWIWRNYNRAKPSTR